MSRPNHLTRYHSTFKPTVTPYHGQITSHAMTLQSNRPLHHVTAKSPHTLWLYSLTDRNTMSRPNYLTRYHFTVKPTITLCHGQITSHAITLQSTRPQHHVTAKSHHTLWLYSQTGRNTMSRPNHLTRYHSTVKPTVTPCHGQITSQATTLQSNRPLQIRFVRHWACCTHWYKLRVGTMAFGNRKEGGVSVRHSIN